MHRYEELEQLYYKKKYKQILIFISIFFFIGVIFIILFFVFKSDKKKSVKDFREKIEFNKSIISKVSKVQNKINIKKEEKNNSLLSLNPIIPKISLEDSLRVEKKHKEETKKEIKELKVSSKTIKKEVSIKIVKDEIKKTNKKNKSLIIKKRKITLSDLINLFNKNKDYNIAIQIANLYYQKGDFAESIRWSKKANELNPNDYQSWLIFAKSLIEVRQVAKASEVLEAYLNSYGSEEHIESLLRSIK